MMDSIPNSPNKLNVLKEWFGGEVELVAEDGTTENYSIKAEFKLGGVQYVALQHESMQADDEVELLRYRLEDGEPQLESIEDDEEWEAASEAYDDMLFSGEEQP